MQHILLSVTWDVNPDLFSIFGESVYNALPGFIRNIRWYGLLWAAALVLAGSIVARMYKREDIPDTWFEKLFLWVAIGLIIGARLGHCLFYEPEAYLSHPLEIFKIWKGGLASHGGAIGMTVAVCLYSLKITGQKLNWKHLLIWSVIGFIAGCVCFVLYKNLIDPGITISLGGFGFIGLLIGICISMIYTTSPTTIKVLDRLVIGVALGATSIRLGNLMNSEIYGGPTSLPWGFNFVRDPMWHKSIEIGGGGELPAHPTQLYEALTYLLIFALGMYLYWKKHEQQRTGLILGVSLIGIFLSRFLIEFIKNVQEGFELKMQSLIGIDMGQLLSLPFIIWGIWLVYNALRKPVDPNPSLMTKKEKQIKK